MVKCPFLRAFFGLKAISQPFRWPSSSTPHIEVNAVRVTADLHQHGDHNESSPHQEGFHSDIPVEHTVGFSRDFHSGELTAGFPEPDPTFIQERYAKQKSSIMVLGLSVHTAPVEMRENLAIPEADWARAIEELSGYPHIEEAGILSTCNRLEIYVVALSWHRGMVEVLHWMSNKSGIPQAVLRKHLFVLQNHDASQHLFRVASGLDSLVLGEGQILSQVKAVVKAGQASEGFGRQLTSLFKQAITAGKRVRSETSIGAGAVSVSSAAVELAATKLIGLSLGNARVLVIGAGKMAKLLVKHLISKGCTSMVVLNRSEERVQELQMLFPEAVLTFQPSHELARCIGDADVVFTCTASDTPLIYKSTLEGLPHAASPRHFVDISVPRNVSACVEEVDSATVYNVDDLEEVVAGNKEERAKKALEAQAIIEEELRSFKAWQDSLETVPIIKKLRAYAEKIRLGELEKCLGKMGDNLSKKDKKLIEELSRGIVNKLLHGPMVHLRSGGSNGCSMADTLENMHALERVFNLQSETLSLEQKVKAKTKQIR